MRTLIAVTMLSAWVGCKSESKEPAPKATDNAKPAQSAPAAAPSGPTDSLDKLTADVDRLVGEQTVIIEAMFNAKDAGEAKAAKDALEAKQAEIAAMKATLEALKRTR